MMLALFDPATDKSLSDLSLIAGGLLAAVYYGKEIFFKKAAEMPQPLQTQKIWPGATLRDIEVEREETRRRLTAHDAEIAALREMIRVELPEMERRINAANEVRAIETHKRINEILGAVSELRGEIHSG